MLHCPTRSGWAVMMNLLVDTHTFLWMVSAPHKLSPTARAAIQEPTNALYLSIVSIWEMQIKSQLGKLSLPGPLPDIVQEQQRVNGVRILLIEPNHIYALSALPQHHKDPFDRMLIAQATVEQFTIVSADSAFTTYGVSLLW